MILVLSESHLEPPFSIFGTGLVLLDDLIFFHCEWLVFINEVPPRLDNNST